MRRDLPLGVLAANVLHAAGESSTGDLPNDTIGVVLAAADEADLRRLADLAERKGLPIVRIVEVDPPYVGQLMAIGVRPCAKDAARRVFSSVPMLR